MSVDFIRLHVHGNNWFSRIYLFIFEFESGLPTCKGLGHLLIGSGHSVHLSKQVG